MKNCSSVRKIRHTPMKRIVTPTPRKRQNFLFWQNKNPFGILVINLRQPQNYRFLVQIIPFFSFVSFSSRFSSVTYCPQFGDFLHFCLAWECLSVSWKFSCDKSHDNFWFKGKSENHFISTVVENHSKILIATLCILKCRKSERWRLCVFLILIWNCSQIFSSSMSTTSNCFNDECFYVITFFLLLCADLVLILNVSTI